MAFAARGQIGSTRIRLELGGAPACGQPGCRDRPVRWKPSPDLAVGYPSRFLPAAIGHQPPGRLRSPSSSASGPQIAGFMGSPYALPAWLPGVGEAEVIGVSNVERRTKERATSGPRRRRPAAGRRPDNPCTGEVAVTHRRDLRPLPPAPKVSVMASSSRPHLQRSTLRSASADTKSPPSKWRSPESSSACTGSPSARCQLRTFVGPRLHRDFLRSLRPNRHWRDLHLGRIVATSQLPEQGSVVAPGSWPRASGRTELPPARTTDHAECCVTRSEPATRMSLSTDAV